MQAFVSKINSCSSCSTSSSIVFVSDRKCCAPPVLLSEYFEDHLGRNVSGLWRINVYDVETTIKGVVDKVLAKDAHSDKTKRQAAAHAIMEMGQIFQVGSLRCSM